MLAHLASKISNSCNYKNRTEQKYIYLKKSPDVVHNLAAVLATQYNFLLVASAVVHFVECTVQYMPCSIHLGVLKYTFTRKISYGA